MNKMDLFGEEKGISVEVNFGDPTTNIFKVTAEAIRTLEKESGPHAAKELKFAMLEKMKETSDEEELYGVIREHVKVVSVR